jgi:hypothetical protein
MAKMYVFGIGGTGSRVIKSLTLLCASGIEANGFDIVPVIIDPDEANGDLTRTIELLQNYGKVREHLDFTNTSNRFFKTCIKPASDKFRMPLTNISENKFSDYIDYSSLDKPNKALTSLLFSEDNLKTKMSVGFKGNPNIGSVVLNQFSKSEYFKQFASSFQDGDRIFIISSIFGGTGAAGFPLIVKNLRELADPFPNWNLIKRAPIGAITVLPYFGVIPDENSKIDKSTFISKTKAALTYYRKNISGENKSLNSLYYIGDNINKDYENKEGSAGQKNDAHFIELAAALSILDFAFVSTQYLSNIEDANGKIKAYDPMYKEFGIKSDKRDLTFFSLADITQKRLMKPLSQYVLFVKYLDEHLKSGVSRVWAKNVFDETFFREPFYSGYLESVNNHFKEWLKELAGNDRSFSPFDLDASIFNIVKGVKPQSSFLGLANYDLYDDRLNRAGSNDTKKEQKFMSLFYSATEQLTEQKLKIK